MTDAATFFFEDFSGAYEEAKRRGRALAENGVSVRVEKSPYGDGYRLRYIPVEALIDTGISPTLLMDSGGYRNHDGRRKRYAF